MPTTKPMPSVAIWTVPFGQGDAIFERDHPVNRDDSCSGFRILKRGIEDEGGQVHTQDWYLREGLEPEIVLFLDVPGSRARQALTTWPTATRWLVIQESEPLVPRNWRNHEPYERIFTWNDDYVDNELYFKLQLSNPLPRGVLHKNLERPGFAAMIAGNHKAFHRHELYSERVETARWYERNEPECFHLYGRGWHEFKFGGPKLVRGLNLIGPLRRAMPVPRRPSWKGEVDRKWETFARYRFAFCYENVREATGYITEKIFDAFVAGAIPIYWGAPNVRDQIPPEAFIDRREFSDHRSLHAHLASLSAEDRGRMIEAADAFLAGEDADPWRDTRFARTLLDHLHRWRCS